MQAPNSFTIILIFILSNIFCSLIFEVPINYGTNTITNVNISPIRATFNNGALVEYDETGGVKKLLLSIYQNVTFYTSNETYSFGSQIDFQEGKDVAVFRHSCARFTAINKINEVDLMFIAKNVKLSSVSNGKLTLLFNHYKLK